MVTNFEEVALIVIRKKKLCELFKLRMRKYLNMRYCYGFHEKLCVASFFVHPELTMGVHQPDLGARLKMPRTTWTMPHQTLSPQSWQTYYLQHSTLLVTQLYKHCFGLIWPHQCSTPMQLANACLICERNADCKCTAMSHDITGDVTCDITDFSFRLC